MEKIVSEKRGKVVSQRKLTVADFKTNKKLHSNFCQNAKKYKFYKPGKNVFFQKKKKNFLFLLYAPF